MIIHRNTRLTPLRRIRLSDDYYKNHIRVCDLCGKYQVTAPTVYKILHRSGDNDYSVRKSVNKRFRCLEYGLKRLSEIWIRGATKRNSKTDNTENQS